MIGRALLVFLSVFFHRKKKKNQKSISDQQKILSAAGHTLKKNKKGIRIMVEFLVNQLIMNNKDEEHVIVSIEGYRLEAYSRNTFNNKIDWCNFHWKQSIQRTQEKKTGEMIV